MNPARSTQSSFYSLRVTTPNPHGEHSHEQPDSPTASATSYPSHPEDLYYDQPGRQLVNLPSRPHSTTNTAHQIPCLQPYPPNQLFPKPNEAYAQLPGGHRPAHSPQAASSNDTSSPDNKSPWADDQQDDEPAHTSSNDHNRNAAASEQHPTNPSLPASEGGERHSPAMPPGFHGATNAYGYFDCFNECRGGRYGPRGFGRRGNLLAHLRACHQLDVPRNHRVLRRRRTTTGVQRGNTRSQ